MNPKPRILLIGPASPHVAAHYERIRSCTGAVHLIVNNPLQPFEPSQTTYVDFRLRNPLNWFRTPQKIRKVIKAFNPDVVHVHQANAVALHAVVANRSIRKPLVLTVWGSDILVSPTKNRLMKAMVKYILKRVSSITAGSHHLAERTRELLPSNAVKVHLCNFGVAASPLNLPKEDMVYTNRHHYPLYKVDEVIRSFAQFVRQSSRSHWKLVIAGDGPKTTELKRLVDSLGIGQQTSFTGFLPSDENRRYYAKARVYVSLPESDSAAISLLEAMYHRCIPVVSDLPATNEWVRHAHTGVVVTADTDNPIEQAVQLITEDLLDANRMRVVNEVSTEAAERCFCQVLKETIAAASR